MKFEAALLTLALFTQPAAAQESTAATQAATTAAEAWLALADAGDYAGSWSQGASAFRGAVTQAQWNDAMVAVRTPLGAIKSRERVSARYTRQLPGAPGGEYVVIEYQTVFANRAGVETVVPMREPDGSWKVSGYYIK
ncbi:hypothetical protein MasN3_32870 [Massilia varians]|uniref:DUF4019 domain-containing protein n=1 Tax=Massilia varians TaxID=457921 RepID=A0ABM8C931_9BURK|nr:DUF4019 domain-containing protein [Massilia varians]BDT59793.1 hypothetical protein MasN3_32870 [Massilia varians]